jgi:uncharacterized membrane protein
MAESRPDGTHANSLTQSSASLGDGAPTKSISTSRASLYEGPLPPPDLVKKYEALHPGAAEFFFEQVKANAEHRRECERLALNAEIEDTHAQRFEYRLGQVIGGIVVLAVITACVIVPVMVPTTVGATVASVLGGTTIVGLATVFVLGRDRGKPGDSPRSGPDPIIEDDDRRGSADESTRTADVAAFRVDSN